MCVCHETHTSVLGVYITTSSCVAREQSISTAHMPYTSVSFHYQLVKGHTYCLRQCWVDACKMYRLGLSGIGCPDWKEQSDAITCQVLRSHAPEYITLAVIDSFFNILYISTSNLDKQIETYNRSIE